MTHGGSGVSRNSRVQPPATISIRGLDSGPRLTPNSLSAKTRPLSAVVDRYKNKLARFQTMTKNYMCMLNDAQGTLLKGFL